MASSAGPESLTANPKFVRHDSKYDCLICREVLKEAMQTSCGHRICERCISTIFKEQTEPVMCPANDEDCLPPHESDITPDPSGRREIRNLSVYCDFTEQGCKEVVKWKDFQEHLTRCQFRPSECPNKKCGCDKKVPAHLLDKHLKKDCEYRQVQCQHCKNQVPAKLLELDKHMSMCPSKPQECRFKSVGCTFTGTEQDVAQHLVNDLIQHLEMVTVYTANMEVQSMGMRRELQEATAERDQLRQDENSLRQEKVSMKANIENVQNSNKDLKLEMVPLTERAIHLEKQSEAAAKKDIVESHERDVRTMQTSLTRAPAQVVQLERLSLNEGHSGSGEVATAPELQRCVDMHDPQFAQFQILDTASYDGTLMWKLRDYTRRKQDAVQGRTLSLCSQSFFTHRYGYKMCAKVYLNGDGIGKGSHMSLFFVVMRGEYDNQLPWPYQQKVTMTLLDQETGQCNLSDSFIPDPTSSSSRKPITDMNIASGCPLFVSHAVLETSKYVKDDTIMIKFQIDIPVHEQQSHPSDGEMGSFSSSFSKII